MPPFIHHRHRCSVETTTTTPLERDMLDTIDTVELDNLIGELDLFQKEHEAKERERFQPHQQQQQLHQKLLNGHATSSTSEYQTPIIQSSSSSSSSSHNHHNHHNHYNHHNDSTSTTLTDNNFAQAYHRTASDPDKISLSASLNYSITSNASMITHNTTLSDLQKFNCSDTSEMSSKYWTDNNNDLSADTGFENPSFVHLNDTNIVVMRDNDFPDNYYSQNAAEIVVLRCKETTKLNGGSNNNSITDLNVIDGLEMKQRISSFKNDNNNVSNGPSPASSLYFLNNISPSINNNSSATMPTTNKSLIHNSYASSMYGQTDETFHTNNSNNVNVNNNVNVVTTTSNKPAITPRPASLLSGLLAFFISSNL